MADGKPPPPWMKTPGVQQITKMPSPTTLTQRANLQLPAASQLMSQIPGLPLLHQGATAEEAAKLILWSESSKKTMFAPAVVERMTRYLAMKNGALKLIEAMRSTAQPNKNFRGERLVPSDMSAISERLAFARALSDSSSCFDNMQPLIEYTREAAQAESAIDQLHEIFLRQVMIFAVKPLKLFAEAQYPEIAKAHVELEKQRDKFDAVRKKKDSEKLQQARLEFLDQARILAGLMDQMPMHQMTFAKAMDSFVRAEAAFGGAMTKLTLAVKQPDYGKRWVIPASD